MKLITEVVEDNIEFVTEAKTGGGKSYFIEGIFMQQEVKNRNGRKYPSGILEAEVERYNNAYVKQNRAYGELGHPAGPTINLERSSHLIKSITQEGNNFIGKAKIMDTPMGKIVQNLMDEGAKLGVSSRGLGSLKNVGGVNEVQSDFMLATAADIVADPSAPDAFVQGIMEGVDWIQSNGAWVPQFIDQAQATIRKASKSQLEEAKLNAFKAYIRNLNG